MTSYYQFLFITYRKGPGHLEPHLFPETSSPQHLANLNQLTAKTIFIMLTAPFLSLFLAAIFSIASMALPTVSYPLSFQSNPPLY